MSSEIMEKRQELTETNSLLAQQNLVLDQQRDYVETVLDNIAAGVISFDENWNVTTANKAACPILGLEPGEILGRGIAQIIDPDVLERLNDVTYTFSQNPHSQIQRQFQHRIDGQERSLLVTIAGLNPSGATFSGAVAVFDDVTEMQKIQRAAAWQEVARRIAHEIKNPLTPIKLSAQRLEKKFAKSIGDPAFTQSTQMIVRQVEQLLAMVQEFSAFAKLPDISLRRGRLYPILREVSHIFSESFPSIAWDTVMPEPGPELDMDGSALHRAFLNLLINAAEALEKTPDPRVFIRAGIDPELKLARVEVGDNGPDILSGAERERLFEPYFSRKKGGTGLGLTIVRTIITAHQGYVRASRLENGGTLITVELPLPG
jgi:two-component system nitrogen regulation sensor histidine kinase NtrY